MSNDGNLRKKDMRGTRNRHIKAEWTAIQDIGRGEMMEILYDDEDTAKRKAKTIKGKSYQEKYPVSVSPCGCGVIVTRL